LPRSQLGVQATKIASNYPTHRPNNDLRTKEKPQFPSFSANC
jgi:hypothetical protein